MLVEKVLQAQGPTVLLTTSPDASLREFIRAACSKNVGALPVVNEKGQILGIISERDIMRLINKGTDLAGTKVGDVMTRNVIWVGPKDDVNKAIDLMVTRSIRRLPVIGDGKIHGMITVRDVLKALRTGDDVDVRQLISYLQENMQKEQTSL